MFILFLAIFCIQIQNTFGAIFCHVDCKPNSCTGPSQTECTDCNDNFALDAGRCVVQPGFAIVKTTSQMTLSPDRDTVCGSLNLKGQYQHDDIVTLTTNTPITAAHSNIILYVRFIMYDGWDYTIDWIYVTHNGVRIDFIVIDATMDTKEQYCSLADNQEYWKLIAPYTHTDTTSPVEFVFTVIDNFQKPWGIDQYFVLAQLTCHEACTACTAAVNTSCSACATGYKLSGTTCHTTCLAGYGETSDPLICVLCDLHCTVCFQSALNCSACTVSGVNEAFLYQNQCLVTCPNYYVANPSTHTCDRCDHQNCLICLYSDITNCSSCDASAYLLNSTCYNPCPYRYYPNGNICSQCDISCLICSDSPSPCTKCAQGYYMYNSACVAVCPDLYFPYQPNRTCILCETYCVRATLGVDYNATSDQVQADVCFTHPIDFTALPSQSFQTITYNDTSVPLERLIVSYTTISDYCYKINIKVESFIRLINLEILIDIIQQPIIDQYSSDGFKFHPNIYLLQNTTIWNYYKGFSLSESDRIRLTPLIQANTKINQIFSQVWVQQIKKTGIFAFFMRGAQLSSTTVLHNGVPAENMYEAQRLVAQFIFFEVPRWEQGSAHTKYLFQQPIPNLINSQSRLLQTTSTNEYWRFQRTGHSMYYLLDVYIPLILIGICWFLVIIIKCYSHKIRRNYRSMVFNFLHKIHEITMFYLVMSTILQWVTYENQNQLRQASLAVSVITLIYLFAYQTYIFYRLIPYPQTQIGSPKFDEYVEKYSFFLRDLRFEDYDQGHPMKWVKKSLLRPYNYEVLGFFRLVLMVTAMPLFQSFNYGCIICLLIIQIFQFLRYIFTWPYHAQWRNFYKLFLEFNLLIIFIIYTNLAITRDVLLIDINKTTIEEVDKYHITGWFGFGFFISYNALYLLYFVIDVITGCYYTNRQRIEYSRTKRFKLMLSSCSSKQSGQNKINRWFVFLEKIHGARVFKGIQVSYYSEERKKLLSDIIIRGNLLQKNQDKLKTISILIEEYKVRLIDEEQYQIEYHKVKDLYMRLKPSAKNKINIVIPEKKRHKIELDSKNKQFFQIIDSFYKCYLSQFSIDYVTIRTLLKVRQEDYQAGQKIPMKLEDMTQETIIQKYGQKPIKKTLPKLMKGFPVPYHVLIEPDL